LPTSYLSDSKQKHLGLQNHSQAYSLYNWSYL